MQNDLLKIDQVLINSEILTTKFTCDLFKCKGACCTMDSELGAPLTEVEVKQIEKILPIVKEYISSRQAIEIEKKGFWEEKYDQIITRSINNRECVFVFYKNNIARCGIEKAFLDGKSDFLKPISCHLFPIRISDFGGPVLKYEKYSECKTALQKGSEENINIAEFCRGALERVFGYDWFSKLKKSNGS